MRRAIQAVAPRSWVRLPRRSARLRLTVLYGGLFLLSGAALVAITYVLFQQSSAYTKPHLPQVPHAPAIQNLNQATSLVQALPRLAYDQNQLTKKLARIPPPPPPSSGPRVTFTRSGRLARDEQRLAADQHQLALAVSQLAQAVHQVARAGPVEAAQRAADSHQLLVTSGIALAIVALIAVLLGWLVAGRVLGPVRAITTTARRISASNLSERLALNGADEEFKQLGDTLDDLFARLEASFDAQRQFAANASHELRTPLARQRALIQVALADPHASPTALRKAHERVLASEQHLEQLIDGLLTLARGQAEPERHEQLDLATLASTALLALDAEFEGRGLDVRTNLTPAPTAGDPRLVERLIANLIDNAIRHNSPHGEIEITTGTRDRHAFVSVTNTGPTVPPGEIPRLFQPFQRLGSARTRHNHGHGLGLSIVQAIANAHHATLTTRARPQGGLAIEVSFAPATDAGSRGSIAAAPTKVDGAPAILQA